MERIGNLILSVTRQHTLKGLGVVLLLTSIAAIWSVHIPYHCEDGNECRVFAGERGNDQTTLAITGALSMATLLLLLYVGLNKPSNEAYRIIPVLVVASLIWMIMTTTVSISLEGRCKNGDKNKLSGIQGMRWANMSISIVIIGAIIMSLVKPQ
jgi:hypothetical protein